MSQSKKLGDMGEEIAAEYLQSRGYRILCRNYKASHGEIDIVCCDGVRVVFAEVKTRRGCAYGRPASAVGMKKREHILSAVGEYLISEPTDLRIRIDVIEVYIDGNDHKIVHLENAFGR